jgi:5-methylthioadenosine/S-adenosylhomocysteine deaminase
VSSLLVRGGTIVTMNDRFDVLSGDVSIRDGRLAAVASQIAEPHDRVINAQGGFVLPGFIQTHIHLCQTVFRGAADDLRLMDWLHTRVWPMEAAHTPATLQASARLAAVELLAGGTTTVLTMETVHDTDAVFDAIAPTGLRATIGKCMMDAHDPAAPARLRESSAAAIDESLALHRRWHGEANGRLHAAFAPRFAISCSRDLLESVASLATEHDCLVHTHASESREEIDYIRKMSGRNNVEYLASLGLASPRLCVAHCVWVDEHEQALLAERDVKVMHCPSSNLKLGSGIAPVVELRARGVTVSLGADGAACNNRLDMFEEMRGNATGRAPSPRRAHRARCGVDGDSRRRADARPGGRPRLARSRQAGRPHHRRPRSASLGAGRRPVFDDRLLGAGVGRENHRCRRRAAGR